MAKCVEDAEHMLILTDSRRVGASADGASTCVIRVLVYIIHEVIAGAADRIMHKSIDM